jgi:hypothetical protein
MDGESIGISIRMHVATQALQGMLSNVTLGYGKPNVNEESMADSLKRREDLMRDMVSRAYEFADEIIKQETL